MRFRLDVTGVQAKDVRAGLEKELEQLFATTCRESHPARGQVSRQSDLGIDAAAIMALSFGKPGAVLNVSIAAHSNEADVEGIGERISIALDEVRPPRAAPALPTPAPIVSLAAPYASSKSR